MKKGLTALVTAASIAAAASLPAAPAKASNGWAIAAGVAGGLLLTGVAVNAAYGYPNYPYYGPRYGYAYYGGYYGGYGGPAYPAWRPYAASYSYPAAAYYTYGYGGGYGYGAYGYAPYRYYRPAAYYGPDCYWTRGYYGRKVRVCY